MNLKKCQIFTPKKTVAYMLDQIGYTEQVFGKRIVDNSCGNGPILIEVVKRFIADGIKHRIKCDQIRDSLEQCIVGCDIDEILVKECIDNLNTESNKFGIEKVDWNIRLCDGLYLEEEQFDYVIGNPPYVAYKDLDIELREKTKDNFVSCRDGKFDYSYAFIEKGLNLLKDGGKMVIISPSNMFKAVFGKNLRELIKADLTHIIDCSALKIFETVLTNPSITVYHKGSKSNVVIYKELQKKGKHIEKILEKINLNDKWNFTDYTQSGIRRFGDLFKVVNSIATLANKVFIHKINSNGELGIDVEEEILRTAKSPKSEQFDIKQKIIFPYYYENGLHKYSEVDMRNRFPKALNYLQTQREVLEGRDSDSNASWFHYGRSQALSHLNCEKLLLSSIITKAVIIYKLSAEEIPYSGIFITAKQNVSLDSAILILQTKRFYSYLISKGIKVSGDSIRISTKDLEEYRY